MKNTVIFILILLFVSPLFANEIWDNTVTLFESVTDAAADGLNSLGEGIDSAFNTTEPEEKDTDHAQEAITNNKNTTSQGDALGSPTKTLLSINCLSAIYDPISNNDDQVYTLALRTQKCTRLKAFKSDAKSCIQSLHGYVMANNLSAYQLTAKLEPTCHIGRDLSDKSNLFLDLIHKNKGIFSVTLYKLCTDAPEKIKKLSCLLLDASLLNK